MQRGHPPSLYPPSPVPTRLFSFLSFAPGEIFSTHDDQTHGLLIIPTGEPEKRGEEYRGGGEGEEIERGEAGQRLRLPARFMSNWRFPTPKIDKAATSTEGKLIFAAEQGK